MADEIIHPRVKKITWILDRYGPLASTIAWVDNYLSGIADPGERLDALNRMQRWAGKEPERLRTEHDRKVLQALAIWRLLSQLDVPAIADAHWEVSPRGAKANNAAGNPTAPILPTWRRRFWSPPPDTI